MPKSKVDYVETLLRNIAQAGGEVYSLRIQQTPNMPNPVLDKELSDLVRGKRVDVFVTGGHPINDHAYALPLMFVTTTQTVPILRQQTYQPRHQLKKRVELRAV